MTANNKKRRALLAAAVLCLCLPVQALAVDALVPMGCAIGIRLETDGVTVVGFSDVETANGTAAPAEDAGMKAGDVITAVGDYRTATAADFLTAVAALDGAPVQVSARRGGSELLFQVTPARNVDGSWQLGLWMRDGVSGIGTVTYYDPESGSYGALGHGINDLDTGALLEFDSGSITDAEVVDVIKGAPGAPGELCGTPDRDQELGSLDKNTASGIFGTAGFDGVGSAVPVASEEEVKLGPATILTTVSDGGVEEYSVEITRIYRRPEDHRFLMLTVTDPRLLERTGGIVQGMSGSPILQDGKLIGAVTHVLLSDSARGYGISIEDMLEAAG